MLMWLWVCSRCSKEGSEKYVDKKDYGKTPSYMVAQKASTERLKQEKQLEAEAEALDRRGFMVLPEEERLSILAGLKSNWEKLNSDYQRFSLTVDTIPKIAKFAVYAGCSYCVRV